MVSKTGGVAVATLCYNREYLDEDRVKRIV